MQKKDCSNIPNIVSKDSRSNQRFILTEEEFSKNNYLSLGWFGDIQKEIPRNQKIRFPYAPADYPYINIFRGCIFDCDNCYGNPKLQKRICGRGLIKREQESIIKELEYYEENPRFNKIHIAHDFINVLNPNNFDKILNKKFNLDLYYEFFIVPSVEAVIKLSNSFRRCCFYIPLDNTHYSFFRIKEVKNSSLGDIIAIISKKKNCKLILVINFKKCWGNPYYASKVLRMIKGTNIEIKFDNSFKEEVPIPHDNQGALLKEFKYFYKESKKMWPVYRARQLMVEVALSYEPIYIFMYRVFRKISYLKLLFLSRRR